MTSVNFGCGAHPQFGNGFPAALASGAFPGAPAAASAGGAMGFPTQPGQSFSPDQQPYSPAQGGAAQPMAPALPPEFSQGAGGAMGAPTQPGSPMTAASPQGAQPTPVPMPPSVLSNPAAGGDMFGTAQAQQQSPGVPAGLPQPGQGGHQAPGFSASTPKSSTAAPKFGCFAGGLETVACCCCGIPALVAIGVFIKNLFGRNK